MIGNIIFAVATLVVGVVAIYGRLPAIRAAGYAALVVSVLLLWHVSLGLPRPDYIVPTGTVLGYSLDEPRAIYLWLIPDSATQPLAVEVPWNAELAGKLVDAARRQTRGSLLRVRPNGDGMGLPTKPEFYLSPLRSLPPKARRLIAPTGPTLQA